MGSVEVESTGGWRPMPLRFTQVGLMVGKQSVGSRDLLLAVIPTPLQVRPLVG